MPLDTGRGRGDRPFINDIPNKSAEQAILRKLDSLLLLAGGLIPIADYLVEKDAIVNNPEAFDINHSAFVSAGDVLTADITSGNTTFAAATTFTAAIDVGDILAIRNATAAQFVEVIAIDTNTITVSQPLRGETDANTLADIYKPVAGSRPYSLIDLLS